MILFEDEIKEIFYNLDPQNKGHSKINDYISFFKDFY